MYLHIGKNYMIQEKDIICLLNIDSLPPQVYQQLKEQYQNCLIDLSSENPRAFIITKKKEKIEVYISNILPTTIAGRVKDD